MMIEANQNGAMVGPQRLRGERDTHLEAAQLQFVTTAQDTAELWRHLPAVQMCSVGASEVGNVDQIGEAGDPGVLA
jgi:hypothetical protein